MYQIKNAHLTIDIAEIGAEIKAIKYDGLDLLHDSNPEYWNRSAPYLFPNIGTIKDKYTIFDGQKYPLTKHGFARDFAFAVIDKNDSSITLELKANAETLKLYPFKFRFLTHYELKENQLLTKIKIINEDSKKMPFNFGLHPAFKIPFIEGTNFEDYRISFSEKINASVPTVLLDSGLIDWSKPITELKNIDEIILNHEDYKYDAIVIEPMPKGLIKLIAPNKSEIIVDAPDFKTLGIWTPYPKKAPFICIEPWIGYADGPMSNHEFNTKKDLIFLKPNEIWQTKFSYIFNIKK